MTQDVKNDPEDKLYSVRHVAELFSVTTETVRNWIKAGKLPAGQVNGYWRVKRADLITFINHKFGDK